MWLGGAEGDQEVTSQHVFRAAGTGILVRRSLSEAALPRGIGCGFKRLQIDLLLTSLSGMTCWGQKVSALSQC